jgi:integrase
MARPRKLIPAYRLHKASGQAFVEINGKRHYLGPHGTAVSRAEFDRLVMEWLASGRSTTFGVAVDEAYSIAELIDGFLTYAAAHYGDTGPRSAYASLRHAARPLAKLYADFPANDFTAVEYKAVRESMVRGGKARSYVNSTMRVVVRMFGWAASEGLIPPSIPQALSLIPGLRRGRGGVRESEPVKSVNLATVDATLPYLSPVVRAMVEFQHLTGCRPGEVCVLRPYDINRSGDVWEAKLDEHKTAHRGCQRTVYIGPKAQAVLLPYLLRPADAYCFSPREAAEWHRAERNARRKTPVSCGNRVGTNRRRQPQREPGGRYTTQSYGVAIRRACRRMHPIPP